MVGQLLVMLTEMPQLGWIWAMVLFCCLIFTVLDNRKLIGAPQGVYALLLAGVLLLRGVQTGSPGYFVIWGLGAAGLGLYWVIKLHHSTADDDICW